MAVAAVVTAAAVGCPQMFAYMAGRLSADAQSMSPDEEMSSRRGALKLLLMNQAEPPPPPTPSCPPLSIAGPRYMGS